MSQKLVLTKAVIESAKTTKEVLELPAVRDNWIRTYNKVSGKDDGELRFEAEKILFLQAVQKNSQLDKADKFSLFGAFIELAISGLSLREGMAYLVPFKGKVQFLIGWKGRLEQITEIPTTITVHEPQVVFSCDEFEFTKGRRVEIQTHKPGNRTVDDQITHVYFVIEKTSGPQIFIMDRLEVLNIRDKRSASFKTYNTAFQKAKAGNDALVWGQTIRVTGGQYGDYDLEAPMWVTDEIQAFKKTIVKRAYQMQEKTPKLKHLDTVMAQAAAHGVDDATEELKDPAKVEKVTANVKPADNMTEEDFASFTVLDDGPAQDQAAAKPEANNAAAGQPGGDVFSNPNEGF